MTVNADLEPKNSSPNTNGLYIHYIDKSIGTPPSLEQKNALPICGNNDRNIIHGFKNCISISVGTVLECLKWLNHMYKSLVFGDEFLAQGSFTVTPEVLNWIRTWFYADQSVLPHWLNQSFSFLNLVLTQRHCHVRIERVHKLLLNLEAHNLLEYHYY